MLTAYEMIQHAVQKGAGLERNRIQNDVLDYALAELNSGGQNIWDQWPFINQHLDLFTVQNDIQGVITFDPNVDVIRGIRVQEANPEAVHTLVRNQDIAQLFARGYQSPEDARNQRLADDANGCRRLRVATPLNGQDAEIKTYEVYATKRFVPFTKNDMGVRTYPIDAAEEALKEYLVDELRYYVGQARTGEWSALLNSAVRKEEISNDNERQIIPDPVAGGTLHNEIGDWAY